MMNQDTQKTTVVFRVYKDSNEVLALFPYEIHNGYEINSYQHIGQHGGADYNHCINTTRPATEQEALSLKKELERIGYKLDIKKKRNYDTYLKAVRNCR